MQQLVLCSVLVHSMAGMLANSLTQLLAMDEHNQNLSLLGGTTPGRA